MTELADRVPSAELAAALAAVQAELPAVQKNRTADVQSKEGRKLYSYSYADLSDVSAAILPILGKHGLAFTAFPGHEPNGKFGLRYYLLHASGDRIEGFYEIDDHGGMQMVGGRITYARRYCLSAVTGVAAEDDVDARGDGIVRKPRQQSHGDDDDDLLPPPRTAQRKPRATSSPPAQAAAQVPTPAAPSAPSAGGDLPPLPGEEDAPGPSPAAETGPGAPDETDYDTPRTATKAQITAIWTILSKVYHFGPDEKDAARGVCAQIIGITLESSTDLSHNQASTVLNTLSHWKAQAEKHGEEPRGYLMLMLQETARERGGDGQEGGGDGN